MVSAEPELSAHAPLIEPATISPWTLCVHPLTVDAQLCADIFQAGNTVTIFAFAIVLLWHGASSIYLQGHWAMNGISMAGCAIFLTFRLQLHYMESQERAHRIFSYGWCMIFVLGHGAFILGQFAHPESVPMEEAFGTAAVWMVLCLMQHLLLIFPIHKVWVLSSIVLANFMCPGWSQLDRSIECYLVVGALGLGEAFGYFVEHMVRASYVNRLLREQLLQQQLVSAEATAKRFKSGCEYLSHEIRNQLFPHSQILDAQDFSEANVQLMKSTLETVNHILSSVLQVAKITHEGRLYAKNSWFDLSIVDRAATLYAQTAARSCGVTFRSVPIGTAPDLHVYADQHLLRQALTNLLSNACKYASNQVVLTSSVVMMPALAAPKGLEGSDGDVRVRCCWAIEDDGPGVAAEDVPKVLEAFGQVRTGADFSKRSGTGLGLPLAKGMIEQAHNGSITMTETSTGTGTRVSVELELPGRLSTHTDAAGLGTSAMSERAPTVTRTKTSTAATNEQDDIVRRVRYQLAAHTSPGGELAADVLVVDDISLNAKMVALFCKRLGLSCEMATDGDEAVDAIYPNGDGDAECRRFGVVLLDMNMSRMNGDVACRALRTRGYTGIIALLTGSEPPDDDTEMRSAGVDLFCVKGTQTMNTLLAAYAEASGKGGERSAGGAL